MTDIEESESEFDLEHHGILGMKWGRRKSRSGSGSGISRKAKRTTKISDWIQARKTARAKRKAERDARRATRNKMKQDKANRKLELVKAKQDHKERMMRIKIEKEMRKKGINPTQSHESSGLVSDHQRYLELSRKKVSQMSTNEINEWVNRTNAIQNYQRLTAQQAQENSSTGKKIMNFIFDAGKEAAADFAKQQIKSLITKGLGNALKNAKSMKSASGDNTFQEVIKRAKHARY